MISRGPRVQVGARRLLAAFIILLSAVLAATAAPALASSTDHAAPVPRATTATPVLGLLQATAPNFVQEHSAGIDSVTIGAVWSLAQSTSATVFSSSYAGQLHAVIGQARAAGLSVVLDPGLQYPPPWAFALNGQTHLVNQYGHPYTAGGSSGANAINAITDTAVRAAEANYLSWLASVISPGTIIAVRQGGGPLGELHYPLSAYTYTDPVTQVTYHDTDCYWAYDATTQDDLPVALRGWVPGTGTVIQATDFLAAYNQNLVNYSSWLNGQLHTDFGVKELVLMPGFGERPDISLNNGPFSTVEQALLAPSPVGTYTEFNEGLDWPDMLNALPDAADSVAYTTYLDAPTNPPGLLPTVQREDPADYLASLVKGTPILLGGENSLSAQTTAAMNVCMSRAEALGFYIVNWMGQNQLLATAAGTFPSGPTMGQLGAAFDLATGRPTLSVATTALPGATERAAYSTVLSAAAGSHSYSWSLPTGSLPPGLSLASSTGVISGTPSLAGAFPFTVAVVDSVGSVAHATLSIGVAAATSTGSTTSTTTSTTSTTTSTTTVGTGPGPGPRSLAGPMVGMAATPSGRGYWIASADGGVEAFGDAGYFGSMAGQALNSPINHLVSTPDGKGYWLVAADGGIFAIGDARFYGSMGGRPLDAPVVDLAPTSTGGGYWLVAADGGIFAFGDARFHGSMGGYPLNRPVVGISADAATGGYWMVATDGGIFAFDAPFFGSTGALHLRMPIDGMAATTDGRGYLFVGTDGGIFAFGDAQFHGSTGALRLNQPVVGLAVDPVTGGYWMVAADGGIFAFDAPFLGTT